MPAIPVYQAGLGGEDQRSGAPPASQAGEITGQALSMFGKSVEKAWHAAADYLDTEAKVKDEVAHYNAQQDLLVKADDLENDSIVKTNPDGSEVKQSFQENFNKYASKVIAESGATYMGQLKMQQMASTIREGKVDRLDLASKKMFEKYADTKYNEFSNNMVARVYKNPYEANAAWNDYTKMIQNSPYTDINKAIALQTGRKEMAKAAVDSFTNSGSFGNAKDAVLTQFAGVFDQKEQHELLSSIETKQHKDLEDSFKSENNAMRLARDQKQKAQNIVFTNTLARVQGLQKQDSLSDEQTVQLSKDIDRQVTIGDIEPAKGMFLKRVLSQDDIQDNPIVKDNLIAQLSTSTNYKDVQDQVLKASANGDLSIDSTKSLIDQTNYRLTVNAPQGAISLSDPRVRNAVSMIKDYFPKTQQGFVLPSASRDMHKATELLLERVNKPGFTGSPATLAEKILKDYPFPQGTPRKIMFIEDEVDPIKAMHTLKDMRDSGTLSVKDFNGGMRVLNQKILQTKGVRNRKDGTK
jgi:hypothetical protein